MNNQNNISFALEPEYYSKFHCIGGECHRTCCKDWRIDVDKKDYLSIKNHRGASAEIKELISHSLQRNKGDSAEGLYAKIKLTDSGCCPFWNDQGLCQLQISCGFSLLPEICKTFPRSEQNMPNGYLERCCFSSCEEVVRLLMEYKDGLHFVKVPLTEKVSMRYSLNQKPEIISRFEDVRDFMIGILQDRSYPLPQRLIILGLVLRDFADLADSGRFTDADTWLHQKRALIESAALRELVEKMSPNATFFTINNLRLLTRLRSNGLEDTLNAYEKTAAFFNVQYEEGESSITADSGPYVQAKEHFQANFGKYDYIWENLIVNHFFIYKMPIASPIWHKYMGLCQMYSFLYFMAVCGTLDTEEPQALIDSITMASRIYINNQLIQKEVLDEMIRNQSDTLAHMAVLVSG